LNYSIKIVTRKSGGTWIAGERPICHNTDFFHR